MSSSSKFERAQSLSAFGGYWTLPAYCFAAAGGFASGSSAGVAPRSSAAGAQSPAQSLVPLTVPTSLQSIGTCGFTCRGDFPVLGASVCAKADAEKQTTAMI